MTTVENVTQNLIPGFGTPVIGKGTLNHIDLAAVSGVKLNLLTDFAEQIEALAPSIAAANGLANAQSVQNTSTGNQSDHSRVSATGLIATPTDTTLLIDPTTDTNSPVIVHSLRGAGVFFPSFEEDDQKSAGIIGSVARDPEDINGGLSVGFVASTQELSNFAQPLSATSAEAQTQNSKISADFSPLPTISELANTNSLTQARGAGHVLPVEELDTLHGVKAAANTVPNTVVQNTLNPENTQNQVSGSGSAAIDPALAKVNTPASAESNAGLNAFVNDALKQAEPSLLNKSGTAQSNSAGQIPLNGNENRIDENIDADGQVLSVVKKASENSFVANQRLQNIAQRNANESSQTQGSSAAATQAATQAATAVSAQNSDASGVKPLPSTEKRGALNVTTPDSASVSQRTNIDQITPAQRATVNWSSPWSGTWTPERAAGWPEGFSADVIASGLSGLKGEGSGLMGMGLMGGKANAALGGHVAKQLNVNITRAVKAGDNEFAMRMDPPELGKVTVKLKFGADGMVRANVLVERPETLELLQRETRGLEKAIEAGGSKTAEGGISFSLDSGNDESAGKAFAEAVQEDRLKESLSEKQSSGGDLSDQASDDLTEIIDLEEILAHVTPETGLDVRV